jgi:hypothetical protein
MSPDKQFQSKKEYQKPVIVRIELVPEEAVLAVCKDGAANIPACGGLELCTVETPGS